MLGSEDADRIAKTVLAQINRENLPVPLLGEHEPKFTARVLMPRVEDILRRLDLSDLTIHGDGRATAPATVLPSCEFRPDIALLYRRSRITAFEVKFLRGSGRQQSLSAAIGQAVVYKTNGYKSVGAILLDLAPVSGEAAKLQPVLKHLGLFGCIFNKSGSKLISAPSG